MTLSHINQIQVWNPIFFLYRGCHSNLIRGLIRSILTEIRGPCMDNLHTRISFTSNGPPYKLIGHRNSHLQGRQRRWRRAGTPSPRAAEPSRTSARRPPAPQSASSGPRRSTMAESCEIRLIFLRSVKWEEFSGRKDVANFPVLSLFCFFFPRDGDTCNFNTLHNYWSTLISCHLL